jgi:ubiquinone/menaquinone biosynthesis C-methylase UbiE
MINFNANLTKRVILLSGFRKNNQKTAADLGCGSGIDSIALSKNNFQVTGFDISGQMIRKARLNSKREDCKIKFVQTSLLCIPNSYSGKFDLVVSLGNTLANIDELRLKKVFSNAYRMLKKNGDFLIQVVNVEMMKRLKKRILGINKDNNYTIIRFYDFEINRTMFNILRIKNSDTMDYDIYSSEIFPHNLTTLCKIAKEAGFKTNRFYGGLNKTKFRSNVSHDLVVNFSK